MPPGDWQDFLCDLNEGVSTAINVGLAKAGRKATPNLSLNS